MTKEQLAQAINSIGRGKFGNTLKDISKETIDVYLEELLSGSGGGSSSTIVKTFSEWSVLPSEERIINSGDIAVITDDNNKVIYTVIGDGVTDVLLLPVTSISRREIAFSATATFEGWTKSYTEQTADIELSLSEIGNLDITTLQMHEWVIDADDTHVITADNFIFPIAPQQGKRNFIKVFFDSTLEGDSVINKISKIDVSVTNKPVSGVAPLLQEAYVFGNNNEITLVFDQVVIASDISKFVPNLSNSVTSISGTGTNTLTLTCANIFNVGDGITLTITNDAVSSTGGVFYLGIIDGVVLNGLYTQWAEYQFNGDGTDSSGNTRNLTSVGTGESYPSDAPYIGTNNISVPSTGFGFETPAIVNDHTGNGQTLFAVIKSPTSSSRPIFYFSPNSFLRTNTSGLDPGYWQLEFVALFPGTFTTPMLQNPLEWTKIALVADPSEGRSAMKYKVFVNGVKEIDLSNQDMSTRSVGQGFFDLFSDTGQGASFGSIGGYMEIVDNVMTDEQILLRMSNL